MISFLRGELSSFEEGFVTVDVGGVGYGVFMSDYSMSQLPSVGQEVKLYTYLNVREDVMQLFGFLSREDLDVFKMLILVNGVGPKAGLSILSALTSDDLRFAVASGDAKAIAKAPGVGKKTAEKIIIELKDKLKLEDVFANDEPASNVYPNNENSAEAIQALVALGYGQSESFKVINSIEVSNKSVEDIIKEALRKMI